MKLAYDFRTIARNALHGKWHLSALTAFVASLIGAQLCSGGSSVSANSNENSSDVLNESFADYFSPEVMNFFRTALLALLVYALIRVVVVLIIGGGSKLGYARYNLNLVDGKEARLRDLFSQFHRLGDGFIMNFLMGLYTTLWSMLFVIPGIIKAYSYSMTAYIMTEHPEYSPNYAITLSRELMDGNKFRLFCLHLSFIGWAFLCPIPGVIAFVGVFSGQFYLLPLLLVSLVANQFLYAYEEAAQAAFYREISGTGDSGIHADYEEIRE